jgi:CheY-like chemotaxis protein
MRTKASLLSELPTPSGRSVRMPLEALEAGPAPHVLIADRNPASRVAREQQLRGAGFRVSVARTGFEAIVKASCQVPDLILLDESLAEGDIETAEVSRLLTRCPVTSHIPIVRLGKRNRMPQRLLSDLRRRVAV